MTDIASLLQQGAGNLWLFIPSAILLGALHGLEPGHSKTMMAAFIIAIRGTVGQAIMLGLAATVSHTLIVWVVALAGLQFGSQWNMETSEPYFQAASGILIMGVAAWMIWRTWHHSHAHEQHHDHHHDHDEAKWLETGHGEVCLEIYEQGQLPRFRLSVQKGRRLDWDAKSVEVITERVDGSKETFSFVARDGFLESTGDIPEPHEFIARLKLGHGHHSHDYDVEFTEHGHIHAVEEYAGLDVAAPGYQDPHELAHANDIRRRFANQDVTNGQILVFGLTGGLIPCPAAITVLLLCLQLKKITLGATLVLCFSIGLAITMVASGVLAAISVHHFSKRWSGFGELSRKAPLISGALIMVVGILIVLQGLSHLS